MKREVTEKVQRITDGILAMAGVFSSPGQGRRPAGNSKMGQAVFISQNLAGSSDIRAGAALLHALRAFVEPFNVLNKKDKESFDALIKTSSNKSLIDALDNEHLKRNGESFSVTLIKAIGALTSRTLAVVTALKIYDHWGVMSVAQKSVVIAAMGVQLHKTDKDGAVCDLKIVEGPGQDFTVRDALNMVQAGKNPYPLIYNWSQVYELARVYNDNPSIESIEDFAASHKLLSGGVKDSAVKVNKEAIGNAKPSPQYGVGALALPAGSAAPQGYGKAADTQQGTIVAPAANAKSAAGAVQGSLIGSSAGSQGASQDAAATYSKWDKSDTKVKNKGSDGGSAFVAGLTALKESSPMLYGALVSFLSKYSHRTVDSSSPIKYVASLAGISLARIVTGKSEEKADKEGAALVQTIVGKNTAGDYAKAQVDIRGLYASFGVASRSDAYQLSNQAFSEGRITESDLVAMHEIFDIVFNQSTQVDAEKLMNGKDRGLEVIRSVENQTITNHMREATESKSQAPGKQFLTKEEIRARNMQRYAGGAQANGV